MVGYRDARRILNGMDGEYGVDELEEKYKTKNEKYFESCEGWIVEEYGAKFGKCKES